MGKKFGGGFREGRVCKGERRKGGVGLGVSSLSMNFFTRFSFSQTIYFFSWLVLFGTENFFLVSGRPLFLSLVKIWLELFFYFHLLIF